MTRTPRDDHAPSTPPPAVAPGDDALHEALSAWMDGELDADGQRFVLRRLGHDAALAARFERWQRVSLHLRGEPADALSAGFAGRVLRALEGGEAPPRAAAAEASGTDAATTRKATGATPAPRAAAVAPGRRWRWPAAGIAAAAALALLLPAGGPAPDAGGGRAPGPAPEALAAQPEAPAPRGFDLDDLPEPVARPWPAASADTALGRALEGRMARHGGALTVGAAGAWQDPPAEREGVAPAPAMDPHGEARAAASEPPAGETPRR